MERLVEVYCAGDILEAHLLKDLLGSHGIEAQVVGENSTYAGVIGVERPQVWVFEQDKDRAREVLMDYEAGRRGERT
jgi:hypothetical protein